MEPGSIIRTKAFSLCESYALNTMVALISLTVCKLLVIFGSLISLYILLSQTMYKPESWAHRVEPVINTFKRLTNVLYTLA